MLNSFIGKINGLIHWRRDPTCLVYKIKVKVNVDLYNVVKPLQRPGVDRTVLPGTLPTDWKLAEVTAVHKKGSKSDGGNYRPISLTSVCGKILESLVRDYIMKHLLHNNLLSNKQYGFVKGRSTML